MRLIRFFPALAAASAIMATPALASIPAQSQSIDAQRAGAFADEESNLHAPGAIVGLILFAAIIAGGIFIAVDGNDDPVSP